LAGIWWKYFTKQPASFIKVAAGVAVPIPLIIKVSLSLQNGVESLFKNGF